MAIVAKKTYVILQPGSKSNPSDSYRLVAYRDWLDHLYSRYATVLPGVDYANYASAEAARDELNRKGATS